MAVYGKEREKVEKEITLAKRVLEDIELHEIPKLVYEDEKEVVRKALLAYISSKQDKLY